MKNREMAELFFRVADMLAIRGDSIHRILAYRNAAESIESLGRDIKQIYDEGNLTDIPNIGKTLAEKIEEMIQTGDLEFYQRLSKEIPPSLVDMLKIEGLGPKRAKQIYETLGITTINELAKAAQAGQLRELSGLGKKSEAKLLAGIEALVRHGDDRRPLGTVWPLAQEMLAILSALPGVTQSAVAGSLRRMKETIGDIDLMVAAADPKPVMDAFCSMKHVESVIGRGASKSRVQLLNGMLVDLRVLPEERWGTLLVYFTGSKEHNVELRELAIKQGLSLNEHAFTPEDGSAEILCADEESVYDTLGLSYIPPMMREGQGEIKLAQQNQIPNLIEETDLIADLHMHSTWSDGKMSILEMAQMAQAQGLKYIAITDHSVSLGIANGLSAERLLAQAEEIREANAAIGDSFHILHGTEMEIRADGSLDYPDDVLEQLDLVIASLHVSLSQPRDQVNERLLNALRNPHVDMIGHPTGRLIPDRAGADLDIDLILKTAVQTQTILEINANPHRLDLRDSHVRRALELGATLAINTDAHHVDHFKLRHYGVATARRGWATADRIVNTWPLEKLLDFIAKKQT